jgi:hypothetical protein
MVILFFVHPSSLHAHTTERFIVSLLCHVPHS